MKKLHKYNQLFQNEREPINNIGFAALLKSSHLSCKPTDVVEGEK